MSDSKRLSEPFFSRRGCEGGGLGGGRGARRVNAVGFEIDRKGARLLVARLGHWRFRMIVFFSPRTGSKRIES